MLRDSMVKLKSGISTTNGTCSKLTAYRLK